jgi:peptidyl-prolyl cis-trans isomerase C
MRIAGVWVRIPAVCATVALAGGLAGAGAQTSAPPPGAVGVEVRPQTNPNPVVAEVDDQQIHLSEVGDSIRAMPGGGREIALETLYPAVLHQLIERKALVLAAQIDGTSSDPTVRRHMQEAADRVLENAYLRRATARTVTDQMLSARYDTEIKGKPGPEEVHARVILVPTEAEAQGIIAKLAAGADFAGLARQSSIDRTSASGGDLGFVRRDQLDPEVGAVLFALRPGEVTAYPVRTAAGWFVLKTEMRRSGAAPSFAEVRDQLEAESERDDVAAVVRAALSRVVVRAYDMNGR